MKEKRKKVSTVFLSIKVTHKVFPSKIERGVEAAP